MAHLIAITLRGIAVGFELSLYCVRYRTCKTAMEFWGEEGARKIMLRSLHKIWDCSPYCFGYFNGSIVIVRMYRL
jgi:hypothetical protein